MSQIADPSTQTTHPNSRFLIPHVPGGCWWLISLCWLMLGCSTPMSGGLMNSAPEAQPSVSAPTSTSASPEPTPTPESEPFFGQMLPITAQAEMAGTTIQLEVAQTPQQQSLGLMYRTDLEDNRGMLFPFNPPRAVQFWMKNVAISLDMVFIHQGRVIEIAADVPPCAADPCPTYGPFRQLVDSVIELRGGRAAELGLAVGDPVVISPVAPPVTNP